jgi:hypothetical protein
MFTKLKEAFNRAVASLDAHSEALRGQTEAVHTLQTSMGAIEQSLKYIAYSEKQRNVREGRNV